MIDGCNFSSSILAFLYLCVTFKNVMVTSKALVGDNGSTIFRSIVIPKTCLKVFRYIPGFINEIVAITKNVCDVDVLDA